MLLTVILSVETISFVKAKKCRQEQFNRIQESTGMNSTTLRFTPELESGYRKYTRSAGMNHTRVCFFAAFIATLLYFLWDIYERHYSFIAYFMAFGFGVSPFVVGFSLTYLPCMCEHTEVLSILVRIFKH
jgi:hypothetical protein